MTDPTTEAEPSSEDSSLLESSLLSRRRLIAGALLGSASIAAAHDKVRIANVLPKVSQKARAQVSGASYALSGAAKSTSDGTVTDILLADHSSEPGVRLQWQAFSSPDPVFTLSLEARLTGDGDGSATNVETLLGPADVQTTSGTSGDEIFDWTEVWSTGSISLTSHSEITLDDFEANTAGTTVTRTVEVRITADTSELDNPVTDSAIAEIAVTNLDVIADVGGNAEIVIDE